jgi:hypothetical protein
VCSRWMEKKSRLTFFCPQSITVCKNENRGPVEGENVILCEGLCFGRKWVFGF